MSLSQQQIDKIIEALESKGAILPCSRCGSESFRVLDNYIVLPAQSHLHNIDLGTNSVPTYAVFCTNCGNLSTHIVDILTPGQII